MSSPRRRKFLLALFAALLLFLYTNSRKIRKLLVDTFKRLPHKIPHEPTNATSNTADPKLKTLRSQNPLFLQVVISRFLVRNCPEYGPDKLRSLLNWALGREVGASRTSHRLRLDVCWGGEYRWHSCDASIIGVNGSAEMSVSFGGIFQFIHATEYSALSSETLEMTVSDDGRVIGHLSLPLEAMVCGPAPNDHKLISTFSDAKGARLAFMCRVSEQREWKLSLGDVKLQIPADNIEGISLEYLHPNVFSLNYTFTSGSADSSSGESEWDAGSKKVRLATRNKPLELTWRSTTNESKKSISSMESEGGVTCGKINQDDSLATTMLCPAPAGADDELPVIVHSGAFWEVRCGALRLHFSWERADQIASQKTSGRLQTSISSSLPLESLHAQRDIRGTAVRGNCVIGVSSSVGKLIGNRSLNTKDSALTAGEVAAKVDSTNCANAWLVMEKLLSNLPDSREVCEWKRDHHLETVPVIELEEYASKSKGGRGIHSPNRPSVDVKDVSKEFDAPFCEDCYHNGRIIGRVTGRLTLVEKPRVIQQTFGTHTEEGTSSSAPIVCGSERSFGASRSDKQFLSERQRSKSSVSEAQRLASLAEVLPRALRRDDTFARERVMGEATDLLRTSHAPPQIVFVFRDPSELSTCRETLLDIWETILSGLEEGELRFDARVYAYEILELLLTRAELGTTLRGGKQSAGGSIAPTSQLLKWLELQQRTLAWALSSLDKPPHGEALADGNGSGLLGVIAKITATSYFRLPIFAQAVVHALQEGDVLRAYVPEFRGITFSLDCDDEQARLASFGFEAHPPLDWHSVHVRAHWTTSTLSDQPVQARVAATGTLNRKLAGLLQMHNRPAWKQRLRRRGVFFCNFFIEWMRTVTSSLEAEMPPHFFQWHRLPGFKTLLTCLLLELSSKAPGQYPEPLVLLTNEILSCTHLHSVFTKLVFNRCSVHDVRAVSTTLNLMNSWMTILHRRLEDDQERTAENAPHSQPMLRSTFDFPFFFKGIAVLLDSEHVQVILKTCEFLYRHFDLLPVQQADQLRSIILEGCLVRLQEHWSHSVRNFFGHLLVFRLEQPCGWAKPRLTSDPMPTPIARSLMLDFAAAAQDLRQAADAYSRGLMATHYWKANRPYAVAALEIYEQLRFQQGSIVQELRHWSFGKIAEPASLPVLHIDTHVLDLEEDRVIWVRESELGKGVAVIE